MTFVPTGGGSPCDGDWCVPCPPPEIQGAALMITPAGNGPDLGELGITVTVVECSDGPLVGYPAEFVTLEPHPLSTVRFCAPGITADQATDALGQTSFSGPVAGGGWGMEGVQIQVSGSPLVALPLAINSPDINGDLSVDLTDVGIFAGDLRNGSYDFRSDFSHDGLENLGDVGIFARHLGESCP